MSATIGLSPSRTEHRPFYLAVILGLACAFVIGKALLTTMDEISAIIEPLCASDASAGSTLDTVEPISSHALPNVPGKRVTIVRVFYGPGGFTRAHRHAGSVTAYVTKGEIRSQLAGGPVETFKPGNDSSLDLHRRQRHPQSVARLRDGPHLPLRGVARLQRNAEILQEMPREAFRLHIGEVQTEAHMRAAAERH